MPACWYHKRPLQKFTAIPIYIYIYVYVYVYVYVYTYIYRNMHTHNMYIYIYIHIIFMFIYRGLRQRHRATLLRDVARLAHEVAPTGLCVYYVCIYTHTYVHIYIYIYIYICCLFKWPHPSLGGTQIVPWRRRVPMGRFNWPNSCHLVHHAYIINSKCIIMDPARGTYSSVHVLISAMFGSIRRPPSSCPRPSSRGRRPCTSRPSGLPAGGFLHARPLAGCSGMWCLRMWGWKWLFIGPRSLKVWGLHTLSWYGWGVKN